MTAPGRSPTTAHPSGGVAPSGAPADAARPGGGILWVADLLGRPCVRAWWRTDTGWTVRYADESKQVWRDAGGGWAERVG